MRKNVWFYILIPVLALMVSGGCSPRKDQPAGKPVLVVSILPQSWFAERIGGDRIEVMVLVGPGQSPHSWEPSPRQMSDLSRAGAWILSGTDFEISLTGKVSALYPDLRIVDGTRGVVFRSMEEHDHEGEARHDEEEEAEGIDRHTWLGREPAKIMAGHIRDTLASIDPAGAGFYEKNYQAVIADIDREFDLLTVSLAPMKGSSVFVFHPAFGYFLDEFGIRQEAVETGGKEPSPQTLDALISEAKEDGVKVIFVQAQFPVSAAKTIASSVGAEVVPLDPLAPDWLDNIRRMGKAVEHGGSTGE
jgi:zinc transport system substrate-binding protein